MIGDSLCYCRVSRPQPDLRMLSLLATALTLPCLNSTPTCVEQLTETAIAHSPEIVILDQKISLIDQRLELVGERIGYSQDRQWTSYITTDPIKLIQNIFGGGDVQRDRIAIADLEIKAADLEAAKAELEFRREDIQTDKLRRIKLACYSNKSFGVRSKDASEEPFIFRRKKKATGSNKKRRQTRNKRKNINVSLIE